MSTRKIFRLGIIGHPVGHTLSPLMHGFAARLAGLRLTYKPYHVAPSELGVFMENLRVSLVDGLNVTVPHKVAVLPYLDEVSESADKIGAVNTIIKREGKLVGDNTDAHGFITALEMQAGVEVRDHKVFMYGAGGAARAICSVIAERGCSDIVIANRTGSKAEELAKLAVLKGANITTVGFGDNKFVDSIRAADIIINTTSVGMENSGEYRLPGVEGIHAGQLVADIVYRPLVTPLLKAATSAGASTLDGLWMLVYQGAKSFELWTSERFPVAQVRETLLARLGTN